MTDRHRGRWQQHPLVVRRLQRPSGSRNHNISCGVQQFNRDNWCHSSSLPGLESVLELKCSSNLHDCDCAVAPNTAMLNTCSAWSSYGSHTETVDLYSRVAAVAIKTVPWLNQNSIHSYVVLFEPCRRRVLIWNHYPVSPRRGWVLFGVWLSQLFFLVSSCHCHTPGLLIRDLNLEISVKLLIDNV